VLCIVRQGLDSDQADETFHLQRGIAGFPRGWDVRCGGCACLVVHRDQPDPAGLHLRLHDRKRRHHHLDAAFAEIGGRHIDVAIGHLGDVQLFGVGVAPERELGDAGHETGVELAWVGARGLGEFLHRLVRRRLRNRERQDGVGGSGDGNEILRIIGQLAVYKRVHREVAGRREQEGVVVVGAEKRLDRDEAVAARPVLDHHRLAPYCRQLLGEQSATDIGAGTWSERYDKSDWSRRPILLRPGRRGRRYDPKKTEDEGKCLDFRNSHGLFLPTADFP
jgi:hypothetical protein